VGSTALTICQKAFRQANVGRELTSFDNSQDFPYNCAMDLLNEVIASMNYEGNLWFMAATTALVYGIGVYSYDLQALGIDPRKVVRVRRSATQQGELVYRNQRLFEKNYRQSALISGLPTVFSIWGDTLALNIIPDQNYNLEIHHYKDMPLAAAVNDTFTLPVQDENVLIIGVRARLKQVLGAADWPQDLALFEKQLKSMKLEMRKFYTGGEVRPAAF
jgi:hypothetical protein